MTDFDAIREAVSARDVAERYGLQFGRNGRAVCPWHADHNPDLRFYPDTGTCYCFACHNGGDAVALTAQIFGLSMSDAAAKVCADFGLNLADRAAPRVGPTKQQLRAEKLARERKRWGFLCEVVREADALLAAVSPDAIPADFDRVLEARNRADLELEQLWTGDHYGKQS